MVHKMNKLILSFAATLLLSACVTDPNSPFYTDMSPEAPTASTENPDTIDDMIEDSEDTIETPDEKEIVASANQCLTSDVLANTTYTVVPKGTKGTIEKSGGSEYFVAGGTRHDVTNVPYSLTNC